jgi:hypothetical protein
MGKNWTKGKGKNSQRKYGKQHRTGNGENITEFTYGAAKALELRN